MAPVILLDYKYPINSDDSTVFLDLTIWFGTTSHPPTGIVYDKCVFIILHIPSDEIQYEFSPRPTEAKCRAKRPRDASMGYLDGLA